MHWASNGVGHEIQLIPRMPRSYNLTCLKQNFAVLREMIANK
jgi:hypothetical protein